MSKLLSAILLLPISALGFAAENYEVPRTEWGLPDLQGVWNFSSQTAGHLLQSLVCTQSRGLQRYLQSNYHGYICTCLEYHTEY